MKQSSDLQVFPIPGEAEGSDLRVILEDGEPWFLAADVASVLGYRDAANALRVLKSGEIRPHPMSMSGAGQRGYLFISEAGFYRLVMRSNRPEADAFQTWVTSEVLPQIRKTGAYAQRGAALDLPASYPDALEELARTVRQRDAALERQRVAELETAAAHEERVRAVADAATLKPKAASYDAFLSQAGAYPLATAAQMLGMGRQGLINLLGGWGVLIIRPGHSDHLRPYTEQLHAGRFVVKSTDVPIEHRNGEREVITRGTTLVTPKGLDYIRDRRLRSTAPAA